MKNRKLFVYLSPALCLFVFNVYVSAQKSSTQTRERVVKTNPTKTSFTADNKPRLENEIVIRHEADPEEEEEKSSDSSLLLPHFNQILMSAITQRIGAPYRYGSEGPRSFDCSGFVWSVFQQAGIEIERGSARALWSKLEPATKEDRTKFGTLVFFNRLGHIGIVADDKGFYHASTSKGVMYSTFDKYWTRRLVGFRRLKMDTRVQTKKTGDKNTL